MADPLFKVLIVGAGHVGPAVAALLKETGDFSVVLADATEEGIRHAEALGFPAREFDAVRPADADQLLPQFDLVVAATPQWALSYLGPMAVKHGVAYIDLAEDSAALAPLASAIRAPTIPCCGFSPGLQNDLANHLVHRFDQAHALQVRVGAVPARRTNRLGYALIWDVDALVNEHLRPVTSIVDGQLVEREPLSDCELLEIGGIPLESFTTSGGSRALCTRFAGQLERADMKSIRYPGYYELMRFLLDDLQLRARPYQLASLLRTACRKRETTFCSRPFR